MQRLVKKVVWKWDWESWKVYFFARHLIKVCTTFYSADLFLSGSFWFHTCRNIERHEHGTCFYAHGTHKKRFYVMLCCDISWQNRINDFCKFLCLFVFLYISMLYIVLPSYNMNMHVYKEYKDSLTVHSWFLTLWLVWIDKIEKLILFLVSNFPSEDDS